MMVSNRLMWIAIFSSISHLVVTDVLTDVMIGVGVDTVSAVILDVDMLHGVEMIVVTTPAITLEFVVGVTYAVDVLAGLPDVKIIDVVSAIEIEIFADENVGGFEAVMTPLEFTLLST